MGEKHPDKLELVDILDELRGRFFSYMFYLDQEKRIKRDMSNDSLVLAMCEFEKYLRDNGNLNEQLDPYGFLKLVLEKDAPLWNFEEQCFGPLGIKRNRSGLSLPEKNEIATQCVAQVLWHLEGAKIPTIDLMVQRLLNREFPFYELLSLRRFNSSRTIEDWIRPVFPVPPKERKKHRSKSEDFHGNLVPIPGVFSDAGINFLKLHFAAGCFTRILKAIGWQLDQILASKFIDLLRSPLRGYPRFYLDDWIKEASLMNGSILPS